MVLSLKIKTSFVKGHVSASMKIIYFFFFIILQDSCSYGL